MMTFYAQRSGVGDENQIQTVIETGPAPFLKTFFLQDSATSNAGVVKQGFVAFFGSKQ
jgi:hypothetical protein